MVPNFRKTALIVLIAVALVVTACGEGDVDVPVEETATSATPTDGGTSPSPDETPSPDGDDLAWATCEHPEGIRVTYPEGWHVNSGQTLPACSAFDPEPFEVPEATEFLEAAALLSVEQVDFETITSPDARAGRVLVEREQMIDGQEALRVETESDGDALLPDGLRSTRWFVRLGDNRTLTLVTHQVEGADYERNKQFLDHMAMRLELPDG